jgi:hypothetical protein
MRAQAAEVLPVLFRQFFVSGERVFHPNCYVCGQFGGSMTRNSVVGRVAVGQEAGPASGSHQVSSNSERGGTAR